MSSDYFVTDDTDRSVCPWRIITSIKELPKQPLFISVSGIQCENFCNAPHLLELVCHFEGVHQTWVGSYQPFSVIQRFGVNQLKSKLLQLRTPADVATINGFPLALEIQRSRGEVQIKLEF